MKPIIRSSCSARYQADISWLISQDVCSGSRPAVSCCTMMQTASWCLVFRPADLRCTAEGGRGLFCVTLSSIHEREAQITMPSLLLDTFYHLGFLKWQILWIRHMLLSMQELWCHTYRFIIIVRDVVGFADTPTLSTLQIEKKVH